MARPDDAAPTPPSPGRRALKALAWAGAILAALVLAVALGLVLLDTPPGHALDAKLLARVPLPGGARIRVGAIEGSIWGRMTLEDVALADPKGVFLKSPRLVLDWRPWALLHRRIVVREVSAATLTVLRRPNLAPSRSAPSRSRLPSIVLSRIHVGDLWLEPAVTGDRRRLGIDGDLTLVRGVARADLDMRAEPLPGQGAGDALTLRLDAQPSRNRLALDAHLVAPAGGVVDRLLNLGRPLTADVTGHGSWADWRGTAAAAAGGQPLLSVALTARGGRFSAKGWARPAVIASGPAAALTEPRLGFGVVFTAADRRVEGAVALRSAAMAFEAHGGLDLQRRRFLAVALSGRLLDPQALASNLTGRDLRLQASLDGAFGHPTATYAFQAASVGLGGRRIEALRASGRAVPDSANGWTARFQASAADVSGAGPTVAALAHGLRANGAVRLTRSRASASGLQIVSDHLRATVDLDLAFDTGRYGAKIDAAARQVPVQGLGTVDASTVLTVSSAGPARILARGRVHGRTVRLDNATAAKLFGGPAVLDAAIGRAPDGAITLSGLTVKAPRFQLLDGRASYAPADGRISASAAAVSAAYGRMTLKVSGSLQAPQATLHADNLGVGGLTNATVTLQGHGGGRYAITAEGGSRYGPLSADLDVTLGQGALSATVRSAEFAGVRLRGAVRRTSAGPFAGELALSGRGLTGTVRLSADGKAQAAALALRARDADLPLQPPVTIASGRLEAKLVLLAGGPSVTGSASLSGVRRGGVLVSRAALDVAYASGAGRASLDLAGQSGAPFTLAVQARLSPTAITLDGGGSVDRIPIRLARPAMIARTAAGYRLEPAVLTSRRSRVEVSGSYGPGMTAHLVIDQLDLGLTHAFAPSLGLSGRASGAADLAMPAGAASPTARLRLKIDRLTRSTVAEVSEPIGLTLAADLGPAGLDAHLLISRGATVVGRAQARIVTSAADRRPWRERLRTAPLTGGVRFNGDAQILWSLTGVAGQALSGPIAIGADVSGSLDSPRMQGIVRARSLRYEDSQFGALIDDIAVDARFVGTRLQVDSLTGRAGDGTIAASGYADLSAASGFPVDLRIRFDKARLANGEDLGATVSGQIAVVNGKASGALISGDLTVDQGRYQIVRKGKDEIVELTGVHRAGQPLKAVTPTQAQASTAGLPAKWRLDLHVHAPQQLYVRGMGLDSEWRAD